MVGRRGGLAGLAGGAGIAVCLNLVAWASAQPTEAERQAMRELSTRLSGKIVWESNRTGQWELYIMNADGSGARQLTHLAPPDDPTAYASYLRPRFSPDGKWVLFGYGRLHAPVEVWIASADDGAARKVTMGLPLTWTADGTGIYFVRGWQLWRHTLATGEEKLVHEARLPVEGSDGNTVGDIRPDEKAVVVRAPDSNHYFLLDEGRTIKTTGGCEPQLSADGRLMYWVQGPKDFRTWSPADDEERQLLGQPPVEPHNYTYCPTVSRDGRWLTFGASPQQHDHSTSDYEVFIQELRDWQPVGPPVRLTFDERTDRWPNLYVEPDTTAPTTASVTAGGNPAAIIVTFSEPVEAASAQRVGAYMVSGGARVGAARLLDDGRTVVLTATGLKDKASYTLTVSGVRDLAPKPNTIAAGTKTPFVFDAGLRRVTDGLQALYTFEEGKGTVIHDRSGAGEALDLLIEEGAPVKWSAGSLQITGPTLIAAAGPAGRLAAACRASSEITIEVWVKPANAAQTGPARIVTLSADTAQRNFTLGQAGSAYDVRLRTTATSDNGTPSVGSGSESLRTRLTHVVYTRQAGGRVSIFLDGRAVANGEAPGNMSNWTDGFRLGLANEFTRDRPWLGQIRLVAVYNRALTQAEVERNWRAGLGVLAAR